MGQAPDGLQLGDAENRGDHFAAIGGHEGVGDVEQQESDLRVVAVLVDELLVHMQQDFGAATQADGVLVLQGLRQSLLDHELKTQDVGDFQHGFALVDGADFQVNFLGVVKLEQLPQRLRGVVRRLGGRRGADLRGRGQGHPLVDQRGEAGRHKLMAVVRVELAIA